MARGRTCCFPQRLKEMAPWKGTELLFLLIENFESLKQKPWDDVSAHIKIQSEPSPVANNRRMCDASAGREQSVSLKELQTPASDRPERSVMTSWSFISKWKGVCNVYGYRWRLQVRGLCLHMQHRCALSSHISVSWDETAYAMSNTNEKRLVRANPGILEKTWTYTCGPKGY